MYAIRVGGEDKMKAKGVPKHSMKKYTSFESFNSIRSRKHKLHTMNITKVGLTNFDNKRYYLDNVSSLAYGHKHIMA